MSDSRSHRGLPAVAVIAAIAAVMLPLPSVAAGQSVVDQYVPNVNPTGTGPIPGEGESSGGTAGTDTTDSTKKQKAKKQDTDRSTASSSSLPGSDTPSVPLVTIVLIALGLGVALWALRSFSGGTPGNARP